MHIGFLGAGTWGFCLAYLLASKGFKVTSWTLNAQLAKDLNNHKDHPTLPGHYPPAHLQFTTDISQALNKVDFVVESVTSAGIRSVFQLAKPHLHPRCPVVLTSKGIEQNTGLILSDAIIEILGESFRPYVGSISGPSYAQEVIRGLPTTVVGSAYSPRTLKKICETFTTPTFRVYPNSDMKGVAFGGALKNIIAIACGISEGLTLGTGSKAALVTRGLHEIRKLAVSYGCKEETLNGLSGLGDLFLTCSSLISRNFRYGHLIAQGLSPKEAQEKIGMVVEGAYTCVSALQLSKKMKIPMPITEMVFKIVYENMNPFDAVKLLMQRTIKEEHL